MASEAPNLPARPSAMDKDVSIPRRFSNDPYLAFFFPTVLCGPDDVQEKLGLELPEERRVEGFSASIQLPGNGDLLASAIILRLRV